MARLKIVKTKYKTLRDVVNAVRMNKVNYMDKVDMNNGAWIIDVLDMTWTMGLLDVLVMTWEKLMDMW